MSDDVIPDPDELRRHRRELESISDVIAAAMAELRSQRDTVRWEGRAATRVRVGLGDITDGGLSHARKGVVAASVDLDRHVVWCENQRAELRSIQMRVHRWMRAFSAMPPEEQAMSPLHPRDLGNLPREHSMRWRAVATKLERAGISF